MSVGNDSAFFFLIIALYGRKDRLCRYGYCILKCIWDAFKGGWVGVRYFVSLPRKMEEIYFRHSEYFLYRRYALLDLKWSLNGSVSHLRIFLLSWVQVGWLPLQQNGDNNRIGNSIPEFWKYQSGFPYIVIKCGEFIYLVVNNQKNENPTDANSPHCPPPPLPNLAHATSKSAWLYLMSIDAGTCALEEPLGGNCSRTGKVW